MSQITDILKNWNDQYSERQKMQHAYLAIGVVVSFVAGLISLINNERGQQLTYVSLISFIAFLLNSLVWNLLNSGLIDRIPENKKQSKKS
jgi:hypothetical protein